jgi:hypothetical protein
VVLFPPTFRLDKIKQTKKDESRYNYLKTVEHLGRNDDAVGKHIKEQIQMGFSRRCANG